MEFSISCFPLVPDVCNGSQPLIKSNGGEKLKQTVLLFQVDRNPPGDGQGFPGTGRVKVLEGGAVLVCHFHMPSKARLSGHLGSAWGPPDSEPSQVLPPHRFCRFSDVGLKSSDLPAPPPPSLPEPCGSLQVLQGGGAVLTANE